MRMYRELGITGRADSLGLEDFRAEEGFYDFSVFDRVFPRLQAAGLTLTVFRDGPRLGDE